MVTLNTVGTETAIWQGMTPPLTRRRCHPLSFFLSVFPSSTIALVFQTLLVYHANGAAFRHEHRHVCQ